MSRTISLCMDLALVFEATHKLHCARTDNGLAKQHVPQPQALSIDPDHATNLARYGAFLFHERGDSTRSTRLLLRAVTLKPDNATAHCNLAVIQWKGLKVCGRVVQPLVRVDLQSSRHIEQ